MRAALRALANEEALRMLAHGELADLRCDGAEPGIPRGSLPPTSP